ncbi:hypothetical protein [Campylobacter aviculae]|uniref:Lipoprotein n=1 Tax=Campylobacter aviculae TaxID=2510190 RepID=A0A4U7BMN1_9BACT|nr:hypothetical protein [Campylobacter aviculae]TKX31881.1 hypothetical protein CQA76_05360 [Campylobacter aviculae]
MKKMLFAVIAVFFIACGGDNLVKLEYEKGNKELFDYANKLIEEKYPGYNLYSWRSLKDIQSIVNAKGMYNDIEHRLSSNNKFHRNDDKNYSNYILLEKDGIYKLISADCYKEKVDNNAVGLYKTKPNNCSIANILIQQK